jgi:hypothetical protein
MKTYLVSLHLLLEAHHCPEAEIADALHGILIEDMRKYAGDHSELIDWAVAGDDMAASIASVPLPDDYRPDDSAFPAWPGRTIP